MTTYTDAPEDYDGFGTETVKVIGKTRRGMVRMVETPQEHVEWQRLRYASGMYLYASAAELPRLLETPAIIEPLV